MVRFITDGQDTFRVLKETEDGVWVIRYDNPNTPFIIGSVNLRKFIEQNGNGGVREI